MLKNKQKIKLSESLQLGVSGPASQSILYKLGGSVFVLFSLALIFNIHTSINAVRKPQTLTTSQNIPQTVLGAYSQVDQTQASYVSYTVQKGDTLFNIAQGKGVNWEIIAELNNLKAPYTLKQGSTLKIPVPKN